MGQKRIIAWTIINIIWWVLSLQGYITNIDINPWLSNMQELWLNLSIYALGILFLYTGKK